ncbi:MAG: ECF RNA polymerase sigma factor SigD [Planctomycetes bacterium]|nr:ECF RNA polymerase sigma factor SigD [Planctomycetota bacterium]
MGSHDTFSLLADARGGDASARSELLDALRARLVLWCASRMSPALRAKIEPEDLAQETLIAIHRDLDGFDGRERAAFYAWVFRIAENRIRDAADRAGADKRREREIPRPPVTTPGTSAARREAVQRLSDAIGRLPEDHRRVVCMRRFEEKSYEEIAAALGRTETAARVLYCRALKSLRAELGEES